MSSGRLFGFSEIEAGKFHFDIGQIEFKVLTGKRILRTEGNRLRLFMPCGCHGSGGQLCRLGKRRTEIAEIRLLLRCRRIGSGWNRIAIHIGQQSVDLGGKRSRIGLRHLRRLWCLEDGRSWLGCSRLRDGFRSARRLDRIKRLEIKGIIEQRFVRRGFRRRLSNSRRDRRRELLTRGDGRCQGKVGKRQPYGGGSGLRRRLQHWRSRLRLDRCSLRRWLQNRRDRHFQLVDQIASADRRLHRSHRLRRKFFELRLFKLGLGLHRLSGERNVFMARR